MAFKIYKMSFTHAHFGDGYLNTSVGYFEASRLFSALCLEALKMECLDEFMKESDKEDFALSDAFPYVNEPYLPRPVNYSKVKVLSLKTLSYDNHQNKLAEEIYAVPYSMMDDLISGKDINVDDLLNKQNAMYQVQTITKKGADPYEVGVTSFTSSLYVLAKQSSILDALMTSLQYSGLGGKRSSGYGRFDLEILDLSKDFAKNLNNTSKKRHLLLSSSIPDKDELEKAIDLANYQLIKDSGFAYSTDSGKLLRKKDVFKFKAGSIFYNTYTGSIKDVSPIGYKHPVYNYSKGLFYGI